MVPFNPQAVFNRVSSVDDPDQVGRQLDQQLIKLLQENKGIDNTKPKRGRKVDFGGNLVVAEPFAPSQKESEDDDNFCAIYQVNFQNYSGADWVQCISCVQWHCGRCNKATTDL